MLFINERETERKTIHMLDYEPIEIPKYPKQLYAC